MVGYGNTVRRDDAVGRVVAEAVAARRLAGVEVRTMSQLVPEIVDEFEGVERVVFVDAAVDRGSVEVFRVEPGGAERMSHHSDPASILALAVSVGVVVPEVFVVTVPAVDLSMGMGLSDACTAFAQEAERRVLALCGGG